MSRFLRWYGSTYTKWPYILSFMTCYVKGSIADCIAQSKLENYGRSGLQKEDEDRYWFHKVDWKRNFKFSIWSGLYCGSIQHHLYNVLYPSIFIGHSLRASLYKSLTDSFIMAPFVATPSYFVCKAVFLGQTWKRGIANYKDEMWTVLRCHWLLWIPVIAAVMFFVPEPFRIATVGSVSLLWLTVLSFLSPYTHSQPSIEQFQHQHQKMQTY